MNKSFLNSLGFVYGNLVNGKTRAELTTSGCTEYELNDLKTAIKKVAAKICPVGMTLIDELEKSIGAENE